MAELKFRREQRKDIFLYKTSVENLFINEFLPDAPGEYVKVFLFGLMYAQYEEELDTTTMGIALGMTEDEIYQAWKYWDSKGLVRIGGTGNDVNEIEFVRQIDQLYGKTETNRVPEEKTVDDTADAILSKIINQQLRALFDKYTELTGRTLGRQDTTRLKDAVNVYNISPDILDFAMTYCTEKDHYEVKYICQVARNWVTEGYTDVAQVKMMLDKRSKRYEYYRKIFEALGFKRSFTDSDKEIMDRWFDEMNCSIMDVLDACKAAAGLRDPNLKYVNKVLENRILEKGGINPWKQNAVDQKNKAGNFASIINGNNASTEKKDAPQAKVSRKVLSDYFEYLREEGLRAYHARIDEVSTKIPGMRELLQKEKELNRAFMATKPGDKEKRHALKEDRRVLDYDKKIALTQNGYTEDYLERKYRCNICKDTGYTDEGRVCTCCKERAEEAFEWIQRKGNQ